MKSLCLLLLVSTTALADDAGLLRCRAIGDSAARLACYDALVVPSASPGAATATPVPSRPQAQPAPRASTTEQIGLEYRKEAAALDAIESAIPGRFDGWGPNENIRLANGQVWQVTDGSSGALRATQDPKARIRRGALGAFYLEIEGTNRSPRVKRLQ